MESHIRQQHTLHNHSILTFTALLSFTNIPIWLVKSFANFCNNFHVNSITNRCRQSADSWGPERVANESQYRHVVSLYWGIMWVNVWEAHVRARCGYKQILVEHPLRSEDHGQNSSNWPDSQRLWSMISVGNNVHPLQTDKMHFCTFPGHNI